MLKEIEKLEEETANNIRRAMRYLLVHQHILERRSKALYGIIASKENYELICKIADACGFSVHRKNNSAGNGLISLVPMSQISMASIPTVRKNMVKILVCLHKIYNEKAINNEFDDKLRIPASIDDLADLLELSGSQSAKAISGMLDIIEKKFRVIENLEKDEDLSNNKIFLINEAINVYVSNNFVDRWEEAEGEIPAINAPVSIDQELIEDKQDDLDASNKGME